MAHTNQLATLKTFLVLSFMSFLVPAETLTCNSSRCPLIRSPYTSFNPTIRFPFKLRDDDQADRCGYPGFDLSCNGNNQTIISMPSSGKLFAVTSINYMTQNLKVNDQEHCLPGRYMVDFSVDFPFELDFVSGYRNFTFLNCTTNQTHSNFYFMRFPCLSGFNYTVGAVLSYVYNSSLLSGCSVIKTASVPLRNWDGTASSFYEDVSLSWTQPSCEACEGLGGSCGFRSSSGLEVACSDIPGAPTKGFSRNEKIGIVFGTVVGFIMLCVFAFHFSGKANVNVPQPNFDASMALPVPALVTMGLSRSIIESYPKHVFGESESEVVSNSNGDNMACPICLSEYKVKEEVRMISECNHFFHVICADEWLQRNATCPLCRQSVAGGPPSFVTASLSPSSHPLIN